MRRKKIPLLGLILLVSVGLLTSTVNAGGYITIECDSDHSFQLAEDFIISSNEDWEDQGWLGNGTPSLPYLVENLDFHSMSITNSDVSFVIQNCQFEEFSNYYFVNNGIVRNCVFFEHIIIHFSNNSILSNLTTSSIIIDNCNNIAITGLIDTDSIYEQPFIRVQESVNTTIDRCNFEGVAWGVYIEQSFNCTIQNGHFTDCGYWPAGGAPGQGAGIRFVSCKGCLIQNNTFSDNEGSCIEVESSVLCNITDNFVDKTDYGPLISSCEECNINNNTLNNGLYLSQSINCNITWNELGVRGLKLYSSSPSTSIHTVLHNTLLGKILQYIVNESDSNYTNNEYGQAIIANSNQVRFTNNEVFDFGPGIQIINSSNCSITEVTCNSIIIEYSSRIEIQHSDVTGKSISTRESPETLIDNNTIVYSGISVFGGSIRSNISNNKVLNASGTGINISASECRIENNTVSFCSGSMSACYSTTTPIIRDYGAIEIYSDDCLIKNNSVIHNSDYGIWITGDRNIIYQNTMIANSLGNALSSGQDNQWDNGIDIGNYWDDWLGFGIYNVPGTEGAIDRFPTGRFSLTDNPGPLLLIVGFSGALCVLAIILLLKTGFVGSSQSSTTQIYLRIQTHHELYP